MQLTACRLRASGLALLVLCVAATAAAQTPNSVIVGTVRADDGSRLAGVTVTVENPDAGLRRSTTTDGDGHYWIDELPIDATYAVRVSLDGFASVSNERVVLPKIGATVDFVLKLTLLETVSVAASPLQAEHQSVVQQTVSERLVHALPLASRNFLPLASLAAGFTGNPNFPSPQGQLHWTNNVLVDGASHFSKWRSAPRTFYSGYTLESIKEVQVMTNRFSAEYGEALATVTSAITKSGEREFHGSAQIFVQDSAMNEPPAFTAPYNPPSNAQRFGVTFGGPVTADKDRTHFLQSYEGMRSRSRNAVVSPAAPGATVPSDQDEHVIFLRVDHHPAPTHFLMTRYNGQFLGWHDERGSTDLPGTGIDYTNSAHTWLTSDRREFGGTWLNDLRFQFSRFTDVRRDLNPTVWIERSGYSREGGTIGPAGYGADPEDTWEAADNVSLLTGPHALKIGGGVKYVRDHNPSLPYGYGAYFFGSVTDPQPLLFVQGIAPTPESAVADPRSTSVFGFVQEDWRVSSGVTLNLGLRYDVERIANLRNFTAPADTNNLQPRLGVAWRPFSRTVFRGGAGIYTQQHLLYQINRVDLEGPDGTVMLSLAPGSPLFPRFPAILPAQPPPGGFPPRNVQFLAKDFRNPSSIQATIGLERIVRSITLAADYVYLHGRDLMSLVDLNAPASLQKPAVRTVAEADATRPLTPVQGGVRRTTALGNEGESWYHALQVKAERSVGRLQVMGSYTYAHGEDMLNYEVPEDSRNLEAERARSANDIRHNLAVGATWAFPGGNGRWFRNWTLSGVGLFRSARPYTITWGDDRNGTTQNDARPGGRNTASADGFQNIDLALTRRWMRGSRTFEGRVEAFNVLNTTNYDEYIGARLSTIYGQPVSAFPMRRFQLAMTVRF